MVYGGLTMCMEMTGEGVGGCIIINRATWPVILSRSVLLQRRGEESFNKVPNKLKFPTIQPSTHTHHVPFPTFLDCVYRRVVGLIVGGCYCLADFKRSWQVF